MEKYANPYYFKWLFQKVSSYLLIVIMFCFLYGLYEGLYLSPPDYQQKETVRIMYIHVPAAWGAMGVFFSMGICSVLVLWRRHHLAGICAKVMAPIGSIFCLICLITGSLWGRPTWGTYWIWDARLTSMLILFFIYCGFLLLHSSIQDRVKAMKIASIFCLIGLIDLPIIKFSVEWWNTLHQGPSIFREGGPSIHVSMLKPLLVMFLGYISLAVYLVFIGVQTELIKVKLLKKGAL